MMIEGLNKYALADVFDDKFNPVVPTAQRH